MENLEVLGLDLKRDIGAGLLYDGVDWTYGV